MKIYKRADFLNLPEGTLFRIGRPYCFGNIQVKASTLENDFVCMELGDWESDNPADWDAKCEKMRNGESVPMAEDYFGRDGCYDDALFLVLEKDDLLTLRVIVNDAIAVQDAAKKSSILSFFFNPLFRKRFNHDHDHQCGLRQTI